MDKQEYNNVRNLVIDIHSDISPSNVVLYKDSIEDTILVCRLISNSYYYTIPENAKIRVSINDIEIDSSNIVIINRFKGLFKIKLNNTLFDTIDTQYEVNIDVYFANSDIGYGDSGLLHLQTTVFYSSGEDTLNQSVQSIRFPNTNYNIPNNPSPDWDEFLKQNG